MRSSRMNCLFFKNNETPYARRYVKQSRRNHREETSQAIAETNPASNLQQAEFVILPCVVSEAQVETTSQATSNTVGEEKYSSDSDNLESDDDNESRRCYPIPHTNSSKPPSETRDEEDISIAETSGTGENPDDSFESLSESSGGFEDMEDKYDSEEEDFNTDDLLHPQLSVSRVEVMIMLMNIFMRHNLTNAALTDILRMINVIVGCESMPRTFYKFSKFFAAKEFVRHYTCKKCGLYLENNVDENCNICNNDKKDTFISFNLKSMLKDILLRNWARIQEYKLSLQNNQYIRDIVDGAVMQSLGGANKICITFNTDGVAIFNSNVKKSLWPIIVTINDLPPALRFLRRNVIIAGLWMSNSEPNLEVFMRPFFAQLQKLTHHGIRLMDDLTCRILTVCCCADSVARCKLQQIKQFNGYEACSFCMHPGSLTDSNQIRYSCLTNVLPRNHDDVLGAMDLYHKRGDVVSGIKGISCLIAIPNFNIVKYCPVDYMHAILLGVCKQLCRLWFEDITSGCYIKRHIDAIDSILMSIHPFKESSRYPRKISDRKSWKANEWQNWLLIYSSVCLKPFLPENNYKHFQILVVTIAKLLKDDLTNDVIKECEISLIKFVQDFESLYGTEHMTYNVHLITHIPDCVRNYGPLWAFSLFFYEDINGVLKKYVKGPKEPILQIATRCVMSHKRFNNNYLEICHENVSLFCASISNIRMSNNECTEKKFTLPNPFRNQFENHTFYTRNHVTLNRYVFKPDKTSLTNQSKQTSNDSVFTINIQGVDVYGIIKNIIYDYSDYYFLYTPICISDKTDTPLEGTIMQEDLRLTKADNSCKKCVLISLLDKMYICRVEFVPWVD